MKNHSELNEKRELERLFDQNFGLIVSQAVRFSNTSNESIEELIQIGSLGMIKAIRNYEEGKAKFSTYAVCCIRNAILNHLNKNVPIPLCEIVEIPEEPHEVLMDYLPRLSKIENKVMKMKVNGDSIKEMAEQLDLSANQVKNILYRSYRKIRQANEENTDG